MSVSRLLTFALLLSGITLHPEVARSQQAERVTGELLALYDFREGGGQVVHDRSGVEPPLDLNIEPASGIRWLKGGLRVESSAAIVSSRPAQKIIDAVQKSNAITVEAWLKPANNSQTGPARIVSLSADTGQRNFTLGQEKDVYDVRFRSSRTDPNGLPSSGTPKNSLRTQRAHVVVTREAAGVLTIYLDGRQVANKKVDGHLKNWNSSFRLVLANEVTKDRSWLGELHLVAIYGRALSAKEVQQNFRAGGAGPDSDQEQVAAAARRSFSTHIAPLFSRHCLECHDAAIKKGGLDLSRRSTALAGGDSGPAITPGKASGSLLWEAVADDEMPKNRPPLSAADKQALRAWLEAGAAWSAEAIDPADYLYERNAREVWVQRLTIPEYIATVQAAVGVDISREARELLPPDLRADGFSNTSYNLTIDLKHVEAYGKLAEIIVDRMDLLKFAGRFSKSRSLSTDDTLRQLVADMGKWLFRGPLDESEVTNYSGIPTTVASAGGDFQEAMRYLVLAMLQSPRFLYRLEDQRGDGTPRPLHAYELASRLSYIIWGGPPDGELMRAADQGELADRDRLEVQVQRMLQDRRAIEHSQRFVSEWLHLDRLENLRPDPETFPGWSAELASDMRQETIAYFTEIVWKQNRPVSDLLNAQLTFATPELARHYGLKPEGEALQRYDLSQVPGRGGLLTQGSVLTLGGDKASMVTRGLFVLHELLRGTVNAPPPCVNTTPPPTRAGLTQRGISEARIANEKCGVCHARFEPLAFGLEKFDGMGAFRERDPYGNELREDGEILFPGEAQPVPYKSSAELMNLLAGSERVRQSLTWKVTQFSLGRPLVAADAPLVAAIHKTAAQAGGTYPRLITAIVLSDLVQKGRTESVP